MRQGDGGSGKVDIWSTQQRYSVIYADPPWSYVQGGRGAAKNIMRRWRRKK
nr:MAG TPA: Eco57I restriction-modification methylase [Caudoviricetes sp.]